MGVAGDRSTEYVDEHQQEDDRLQRHVDERLGRAGELDDAALGEGCAVAHQGERPRCRGDGRAGLVAGQDVGAHACAPSSEVSILDAGV